MCPRAYNSTLRKEVEAETLRRIVAATVELHAEKGAMATSHADIAERAGVAVPTVYKHFPSRGALLPACMGHVAKDAPVTDVAAILSEPDPALRIERLVKAIYARYEYYEPWFRWVPGDAASLPELAAALEAQEQELQSIARALVDSVHRGRATKQLHALTQVMLDHPTWRRLCRTLGDSKKASRAAAESLQLFISTAESE
jgi:AcrR family transcriptional regulator